MNIPYRQQQFMHPNFNSWKEDCWRWWSSLGLSAGSNGSD